MANFGNSNNPFGSSSFGGQQNAFGNSAQVTQSSSPFAQHTSLFGQGTSSSSQTGSNAFGSPTSTSLFGQQGTSSTFGQTTSVGSSSYGQVSSAFGQSSGFGQTTNSAFGPNTTPGFGLTNSSTLGQTATSGFGQTASFGLAQQTTGSGFGQQANSTSVSSIFGKTTGSGQTTSSSSGQTVLSGFGQTTQSGFGQTTQSGYGQTTQSGFGHTTQSGFGQTTQSAFGQTTGFSFGHTQAGLGQTTNSGFGQTTQASFGQQTNSGVGQSSLPTPFSKPSDTSSSQKNPFGNTTLFGKVDTASSNMFKSPTTGLFGQTSSTAASPISQSSGLFGRTSTTSLTTSTSSSSLFQGVSSGQNQSSTASETSKPSGTTSLFGKTTSSAGSGFGQASSGFFVKKERQEDVAPSGLFGVKTTSVSDQTSGIAKPGISKGLFGKQDIKQEHGVVKSEPSTGEFRKPSLTESRGLFGKGVESTSQTRKKIDRSRLKEEEDDSEDHKVKREPFKSTGGLFGKPKPTTHGADSQHDIMANRATKVERDMLGKTGEKYTAKSGQGLFGKPAAPQRRRSSTTVDEDRSPRQALRRQISDDIGSKVAIVCRNVASKYNSIQYLKKHFERFGQVMKVYPNSPKMQATIHFKTHDSAAEAKRRGRLLAQGITPMTIFWSSYSPAASSKPAAPSKSLPEIDQRPTGRSLKRHSDTSVLPKSKRTSWQGTDNTEDELASMSGTQDLRFDHQTSPPPRPRVREIRQSPEKKARAVSPGPTVLATDLKSEKLHLGMFQGVVARSTGDRVNLLSLRDKYVRQNRRKKNTDISTAKAFIGTCPDMCPEKERYYREDTRRLHYYELVPGTENIPGRNPQVDHRRAVKEYLRSSPDQDEPLPHELRPIPVLLKTMTYLLREIGDRGEDGRWADWFDYLWNRMRGIRKDITQQQLGDRAAVELIEKCARFHIFSSERLCEEDMHAFDAKINNENLTKCLQTLREFYYDLEKKQKCFCECEAEFRAYTVLMNLNQGDILREVQQLRPEVRTSPEILFAMQVYYSLNNNNYIKFFRLVKQGSFGNACIMHRYFTQVRNRALLSMMKGYSMGVKNPAQIPLNELVRLLGFEDENEASDFCEHYGFLINDGEAILDRAQYIEPEAAWLPRRSITLIESKLMVSIGEMINGGLFVKDDSLIPSSSFDEHNRFYSAVELPTRGAEAQEREVSAAVMKPVKIKQEPEASTSVEVKQEPKAVAPEPVEVVPTKAQIPNEYIKDTAKMLFWEVIDEMSKVLGHETIHDVQVMLDLSRDLIDTEVFMCIRDELQDMCQEVYDEELAMLHKALKEEKEQRRERVTALLMEDIVFDLLHQESLNLATIQIREVKAQLKKESMMRVTVDINQELIDEVLAEMTAQVSSDVFEVDVTKRLQELDEFEKIVKLSRAGKYLSKWKKEYKAVTKLKRGMQEFPSATCMENLESQVKNLVHVDDERITDGQFYVNRRARLTVESVIEIDNRRRKIESQFTVHNLYQGLLQHTAWQPLDITRVIGKQLIRNVGHTTDQGWIKPTTIFWKLLLCLPDIDDALSSHDDVTTCHIRDWLLAKFSKGGTPNIVQVTDKSKVISLYKSTLPTDNNMPGQRRLRLGICVRSVDGTLEDDDGTSIEEERNFLGTSGLVFVLPADPPLDQPDDTYWSENQSRLQRILEVKPTYQELPLVIIVPASANQSVSFSKLYRLLSLNMLIDEGYLCDVHMVVLEADMGYYKGINVAKPHVSEQICESLQWMAERTREPPRLTVSYLKDCIERTLLKSYYTPVQQNLKKRKMLRHLEQHPNELLELYNSVIQHVDNVITADNLRAISWPVPEFIHSTDTPPSHWNSADHFEYLSSVMQSLSLPEFCPLDQDSEEWLDVQRDIWKYVTEVAGRGSGVARVTLYSRIKKLLKQIEVDFEETCYLQEGKENCQPSYINVPWSKLLSICIDYRFDATDFTDDTLITSQVEADFLEFRVAYNAEDLRNFKSPPEWKHVESDKHILDMPSLDHTILKAVDKVDEKNNSTIQKAEISIIEDPSNVSVLSAETRKMSSDLLTSLRSERRRSDHFQKYLENAFKAGELENVSPGGNLDNSMDDFNNFNSDVNNFSMTGNQRRLSFDATAYFGQGKQNDLSRIFDQSQRRLSDIGCSRLSDIGQSSKRRSDAGQDLLELSQLSGKRRRERLSEVYGNDPVMMCLKQPSITEEMQNLRDNIKANRRESDLFEKRLQSLLQNN